MIHGEYITVETKGFSDVVNITDQLAKIVENTGVNNGFVNVFSPGSTASVTTIEHEGMLLEDYKTFVNNLLPVDMPSKHSVTWGDHNGFAHLRATLFGPGVTIPIFAGMLVLGKWQHAVIIDHDNRPRQRTLFVQVFGE